MERGSPEHRKRINMKQDEALLLAISDLHVGSTVALIPPNCPLLDDGYWKHNVIQEWIWSRWIEFAKWVKEYRRGRKMVLLLNGDLIEGVHHGSKEIVHADPGIHARIATDILKPFAAMSSRVYVTRGTGAHVGHSSENAIGRALDAVDEDGIFAKHHQLFRIRDSVISAKHHISTSSRRALRGTALSINLEEERAECSAAESVVPDLVIRSHRHTFGHYATEDAQIVVTPAWQSLTSYGWKVVPNAIPRIGGVIFDWSMTTKPVVVPWVRTIGTRRTI